MPNKVAEEVSKNLASLKEVLSGTGDKEPQTEAVAQLAQELYNTDLLINLISNLQRIDFEVGYVRLHSAKGESNCVCVIKKKKNMYISILFLHRERKMWFICSAIS